MTLVAVVLAAGEGRRLRPLTTLRPKALCPVANVPLVDRAIAAVSPYVDAVAVNAHHLRDQLERYLAGRVHIGVEEPIALGTAGALGALRDWIAGRDVLIHNADAYLTGSLHVLVSGWDGERCRLLVRRDPCAPDFGDRRYVGAALLPWRVIAGLPAAPAGLYELVWRAADAAGRLDLVETDGVAIDCGTPHDYLAANLHASGGISVIGPGAVVEGRLIRSVVWPGAVVRRGERLVESIRADRDVTVATGLSARRPFRVGGGPPKTRSEGT